MGQGKEKSTIKKLKFARTFSAGGVVFKKEGPKTLFLIIKPVGTDRWQLPKGLIEKGESAQEAAIREVAEETGVEAEVVTKLGMTSYFFVWEETKYFKTVTFFLMKDIKVTGQGHDAEVEEVALCPYQEAFQRLTFKDDKNLLKKAKETLARGIQTSLV